MVIRMSSEERRVRIKDAISLESFLKRGVVEVPIGEVSKIRYRKSKDKLRKALEYFRRLEMNFRDAQDVRAIESIRKTNSRALEKIQKRQLRQMKKLFTTGAMKTALTRIGFKKVRFEIEDIPYGYEVGKGMVRKGYRIRVIFVKNDGSLVRLKIREDKSRSQKASTDAMKQRDEIPKRMRC